MSQVNFTPVSLASVQSGDSIVIVATREGYAEKRFNWAPPINVDRLGAQCLALAEQGRSVQLLRADPASLADAPGPGPANAVLQSLENQRLIASIDREIAAMSGPRLPPPSDGIVDTARETVAGYEPRVREVHRPGHAVSAEGLQKQRKAFERMPFAVDACKSIVEAVRAERREDVLADTASLRMSEAGLLVLPETATRRQGGEPYTGRKSLVSLEAAAVASVFNRVCAAAEESSPGGAVANYRGATLTRARASLFNGLATHLGEVMRDSQGGGADHEASLTLIRTRLAPDPQGQPSPAAGRCVYAVASKSYAPCDADKVAEEIIEALQGAPVSLRAETVRGTARYDGTRSYFDLVMFTDLDSDMFRMGDAMKYSLRVQADDAGKGSLKIMRGLYRPRCANMAIFEEIEGKRETMRHRGSSAKLVVRLRDALRTGLSEGRQLLTVCENAAKASLLTPGVLHAPGSGTLQREREELLSRTIDRATGAQAPSPHNGTWADACDALVAGAFRGLIAADRVSIPARQAEWAIPLLVSAHNDQRNEGVAIANGPTRASLVNALTLYAHAINPTASLQSALEADAGQLMQSKVIPWLPAPV